MRIGLFWLQAIGTAVGGFLGWYIGGMDGALYSLIIFAVVDYITGVMCAIHDKNVSSKIGARGIFKKLVIFMLVGVAHLVDTHVMGHDGALRTAAVFFYLTNEGISIIENASHLGSPVPARLRNVLAAMDDVKEKEKQENEDK